MRLLDVTDLCIRYPGTDESVVSNLSFGIDAGESLGIVGESGSGKTQTAMALMGLLPGHAEVSGQIRFDGQEFVGATTPVLNRYRARRIAMVFQDPMAALNPYLKIGKQMRRILLDHELCDSADADARTLDMLQRVGLPDAERQYHAYPYQLSGGMRQRAMIGAALIGEPDLLIADEPTTALDVTVQAQILSLLRDLRAQMNAALILITHDLGVVAGNCDHVLVMDRGKRVEEGPVRQIFQAPEHACTARLLAAAPRFDTPTHLGPLAASAPVVLEIEQLAVSFRERRRRRKGRLNALWPLDLSVAHGETLSIVGESGSGKTSLAKALLGLIPAGGGTVRFLGNPLAASVQRRSNAVRRGLQMVFQDPVTSLNPAMRVAEIVAEPIRIHEPRHSPAERNGVVIEMLQHVGLDRSLLERFPHELSGGQAQRVAIARALVVKPRVLICDEAVAALDGTIQGEILALLQAEQSATGLSLIFITHDLSVVRQISHRVLVLYMGRVCEVAGNGQLFARPRHPYTKAMLESVPVADPEAEPLDLPLAGEVSSIINPPPGCPFHPRCQHAVALCRESVPELTPAGDGYVACHRSQELDLSY